MILHLSFELPKPNSVELDADSPDLTEEEAHILKSQIRKNAVLMDDYIERLDLVVNKEKHSNQEDFVKRIRSRLNLLMEENDTFRKVWWRHIQKCESIGEAKASS